MAAPRTTTRKKPGTKARAAAPTPPSSVRSSRWLFAVAVMVGVGVVLGGLVYVNVSSTRAIDYDPAPAVVLPTPRPALDKHAYDQKLLAIALGTTTLPEIDPATTTASTTATTTAATKHVLWPAQAPYPNAGAILPFKRIVAYYGNFLSSNMGVLGEYPDDALVQKLGDVVGQWAAADPSTPVVPAIDYIAVVAQGSAGSDGMYRARMPDSQIDHALALARRMHGLLFLDVQVGLSTLQKELPQLEKYLKMPDVHLAIDPEFSMKTGARPGTVIGTFDASDINFAAQYLASLVNAYDLPPKILVVHRFTLDMVTNYKDITPLPEVQVVMDMDGWGSPEKKKGTYSAVIYPQPVQFTGFKLFYKNDLRPPSTHMMTPEEVLTLRPQPLYIQYQ